VIPTNELGGLDSDSE